MSEIKRPRQRPKPDAKKHEDKPEALRQELVYTIKDLRAKLERAEALLGRVDVALGERADDLVPPEESAPPARTETNDKGPARNPAGKTSGTQTIEKMLAEAESEESGEGVRIKYGDQYSAVGMTAFKAKDKPGYYVIFTGYKNHLFGELDKIFEGIPPELTEWINGKPLRAGELIEVIEMPYVESLDLKERRVDQVTTKGKVRLTEAGKKKLELFKEIIAGPPLRTEEELRASNWEIGCETREFASFISPDGKWICFTPSLDAKKYDISPTIKTVFPGGKQGDRLSDYKATAAYVWRGDGARDFFDPKDPYSLRDLFRYEWLPKGKLEKK